MEKLTGERMWIERRGKEGKGVGREKERKRSQGPEGARQRKGGR